MEFPEFWKREEFACNGKNCCGSSAPVAIALVWGLQSLSEKVDGWFSDGKHHPMRCNSGFRCKRHNAEVGGVEDSQHTYGTAADIVPPKGMTPQQLASMANTIPVFHQGGIGTYPTFVHVDIRGTAARWSKDVGQD